MSEKLFCMNCGRVFLDAEIVELSRVSKILKFITNTILMIVNLVLLGLPITRRKKTGLKKKKKCDYCDSNLIFPDNLQNREFAKSFAGKSINKN